VHGGEILPNNSATPNLDVFKTRKRRLNAVGKLNEGPSGPQCGHCIAKEPRPQLRALSDHRQTAHNGAKTTGFFAQEARKRESIAFNDAHSRELLTQ
jgi:hypothetical protein